MEENRETLVITDTDMSVPCGRGLVNIRVGAIIQKDERVLMVRNTAADYFYSVGGRIRFGETAEEAIVREVSEELGIRMEIDHLGFIQENYFICDSPENMGKICYEIGFYFYMNVPENFEPSNSSFLENGRIEYLEWVSNEEPRPVFPSFFRTELNRKETGVRHIVCDERFHIRKMRPDDLDGLTALLSDPEVMKHLEPPFTAAKTKHFLKTYGLSDTPRILAVDDRDHRFIGYVIYHDYDSKSKEIGWVLKKEKWGRGIAGSLTKQLIAMAAAEGKETVIECVPEQITTQKIAVSHGFQKTGSRDGLYIYRRTGV